MEALEQLVSMAQQVQLALMEVLVLLALMEQLAQQV
jgi:hypothetical protein